MYLISLVVFQKCYFKKLFFFAYLQTFNEAVFTFRLVWSLGLSKIENFCLVALLEELVTWIGPATNWVGIEVAVLPPVKSRLLCERSMMIEFRHRHFLMLPMSSNAMLQCSNQGFINQILLRFGLLLFLHKGSTSCFATSEIETALRAEQDDRVSSPPLFNASDVIQSYVTM